MDPSALAFAGFPEGRGLAMGEDGHGGSAVEALEIGEVGEGLAGGAAESEGGAPAEGIAQRLATVGRNDAEIVEMGGLFRVIQPSLQSGKPALKR